MRRRKRLKTILAGACTVTAPAPSQQRPIQLHVDLSVDPAQERDMLHSFIPSSGPRRADNRVLWT